MVPQPTGNPRGGLITETVLAEALARPLAAVSVVPRVERYEAVCIFDRDAIVQVEGFHCVALELILGAITEYRNDRKRNQRADNNDDPK